MTKPNSHKFVFLRSFVAVLLCALVQCVCYAGEYLAYGNPNNADTVLEREGYALGYCNAWKTARWVAYRLTADRVLNQVTARIDNFRPDPALGEFSAQLSDYKNSGYSRGHLAPAADMKWSTTAMEECFYLSNICPQDSGNNSGIWNEIENTVRGFACATDEGVFVITGPVVSSHPKSIGANRVAIPYGFYKVVLDETPPQKMIAFFVPNQKMAGKPADYACTVDTIEEMTGYDFFSEFPQDAQDMLESSIDISAWDWGKQQTRRTTTASTATATEPQPRDEYSSYFNGYRKEYFAGAQLPVGSRVAAPVNATWPDTGYWLSTNSNKRHNRGCENYRKTRGYPCGKGEGSPCGKCGG